MATLKRYDYLDMAKGLGMVFVLIGHLQGDTIFSLSPYFHPLCVFIFAFHMPLFFIISGILMRIKDDKISNDSSKQNFILKSYIKKRFKGIMIPYIWFSVFYFSVVIYAFFKGSIAYQTVLVNFWYVISCYGMNVLWFLPALFFGEIIFIFLKQNLKGKSFHYCVLICSFAAYLIAYFMTLLNYDTEAAKRTHELAITIVRPFIACSWIYIGYFLHGLFTGDNHIGNLINRFDNDKISSRIIYICSGLFLMVLCALFSTVNNGVDFRSLVLRNIFFYILCSLLGTYGLILICKGIPTFKLLTFWGTGSLTFMAVHNSETVLYYALKISMYANQFLTHARGYICYLIILLIILIYTSLMILIITKVFPFILGKPLKSSVLFTEKKKS